MADRKEWDDTSCAWGGRNRQKKRRALNDDQVREVRSMHRRGFTLQEIAKHFSKRLGRSINITVVNNIIKNRTYRDVPDDPDGRG